MSSFRYLVTTAWPYVNNIPHLGNLLGSGICADVYSRFLKLNNEDCIYVSGADEYGTPTLVAAKKEGLEPQKLCDKYYKIQTKLFKEFNISFDNYSRTTSKEHTKVVQDIYYKIKQNNYIYFKDVGQLYCKSCDMFLPDRYVEGVCHWCGAEGARGDQCDECGKLIDTLLLKDPYCVLCKGTPIIKKSKHAFFELSKLQNELKAWIEKQTTWSDNAKSTCLGWIKTGLEDRCITRDLKWGVPFLDLPGKVFYVWVDACIGYVTATKQINKESWWHDKNVKIVQFMGKDNIPFHTILFPGMLKAAGNYILPTTVWACEYLNYDGGKFSKSKNRGIFLDKALEILPADYWRYYLIIALPEHRDTDFTWTDFQEKINSDLNDAIGNFIHRTLNLTDKFFKGKIPKQRDEKVIKKAQKLTQEAEKLFSEIKLKEALKRVVSVARLGNEYLSKEEPWKNDNKEVVLGTCLQLCKVLSVYLEPIIPESADKIKKFLNIKTIKFEDSFELIEGKIGKYEPLFNKITDKDVEKWKKQFEGTGDYVTMKDFEKLDLRVAEIISAKDVKESDKLLKLELDIGNEKRTVVAGIKQYYKPKDLVGKKVVFLANLESKKLKGIESKGMVLASEDGNKVKLLFADDVMKPGAKIC